MAELLDLRKWRYLLSGLTGRLGRPRRCPICDSPSGDCIDRKFFHRLFECQGCGTLYRYPNETKEQMDAFYQKDYAQEGLTTSLPPEPELKRLLDSNFAGTEKDAARVVALLKALDLGDGARVLDYGASWGYASLQMKRAGFAVESFELSQPRAALGERIGVRIESDLKNVGSGFDAIYSGHVLEHTPNPAQILRWMIARCRPGGFVVAFTPNGSSPRRKRDPAGFHSHCGLKHPVLLNENFIVKNFPRHPCYLSSSDSIEELAKWDRASRYSGHLEGGDFLLAIKAKGNP